MSFKITIASDPDVSFEVEDNQSILQAASCAGIDIPSCCENGVCATCKGRIIKGDVDYPDQEPMGLMPDEAEDGEALFCCAHAQSDLIVDHDELLLPGESPARFFKAAVFTHEQIHGCAHILRIKLDTPRPFSCLPGQYVEVIIGTNRHALTVVAVDDKTIELDIVAPEDRPTSLELLAEIDEAEKMMVYGPLGRSYWRPKRKEPIILVAGGSGVTPMFAILKAALENSDTPIRLYWGVRKNQHLYKTDLIEKWLGDYPQFKFTPIISEEEDCDHRRGLVHEAVCADYDDLSKQLVYLAGPTEMVKVAYQAFNEKGLKRENTYCDFFKFLHI